MLHCGGSKPVQLTVIMLQVRRDFFHNGDAAMGKYTIILHIMKKRTTQVQLIVVNFHCRTTEYPHIHDFNFCSQKDEPTSSFQYHKDSACIFNPTPKNLIGNTVDSKLKMCVLFMIQIGLFLGSANKNKRRGSEALAGWLSGRSG